MDKKTSDSVDFSQLFFREAEPRDHEEVKGLCKGALGGRDILPAKYLSYLNDPMRRLFVAVYKGRVVAIAGARIVDDGNTLESNLGRALPGLPGVFVKLRATLLGSFVSAEHPQLKRIKGIVRSERVALSGKYLTIIPLIRVIVDLAWKVPVTAVADCIVEYQRKFHTQLEDQVTVERSDKDTVVNLFNDIHFKERYLPSHIIVVDSAPLHLGYKSNLAIIVGDESRNIYVSYDTRHQMQAISIGTAVEMDVSMETLRYVIDYYGISSLDSLVVHTMEHITRIPELVQQSQTAKDVYVAIFLPEDSFNIDIIQKFVQFMSGELFLDRRTVKIPLERQFVLDGEFPNESMRKDAKL